MAYPLLWVRRVWLQALFMPTSDRSDYAGESSIPGYRLLEEIGRGAAGAVWLAEENLTHVRRAIKVLPKAALGAEAHAERELRGIREYQRNSTGHPHLVQILHVDQTPQCYYYAMELADDSSCRVRIADH